MTSRRSATEELCIEEGNLPLRMSSRCCGNTVGRRMFRVFDICGPVYSARGMWRADTGGNL